MAGAEKRVNQSLCEGSEASAGRNGVRASCGLPPLRRSSEGGEDAVSKDTVRLYFLGAVCRRRMTQLSMPDSTTK